MNKFKDIVGIVFVCGSMLTCLITAIVAIVLRLLNPDMTDVRFVMTYPAPAIICVCCAVIFYVGVIILNRKS